MLGLIYKDEINQGSLEIKEYGILIANFHTYIASKTSEFCCWYKFLGFVFHKSDGQDYGIYPIQRCNSKSEFSVFRMSWLIVYVGKIPHTTSRKMAPTIQSDSWYTGTYIQATIDSNIHVNIFKIIRNNYDFWPDV